MTKEDNIKEAQNYEDSLIYSSISEQCDIKKAFVAGADWRINSVWHDVEEKPNGMFVIIIDFGNEIGAEEFGLGITADDLNGAKRWAYVSDLLPERKEETDEYKPTKK